MGRVARPTAEPGGVGPAQDPPPGARCAPTSPRGGGMQQAAWQCSHEIHLVMAQGSSRHQGRAWTRSPTTLTRIGLEVEEVFESRHGSWHAFTRGASVCKAEKHPNADKLQVCKVDTGTRRLAGRLRRARMRAPGLKAVFAASGQLRARHRRRPSPDRPRSAALFPTVCSAAAPSLSSTTDGDGIMELDSDALKRAAPAWKRCTSPIR